MVSNIDVIKSINCTKTFFNIVYIYRNILSVSIVVSVMLLSLQEFSLYLQKMIMKANELRKLQNMHLENTVYASDKN